MKEKREMKSLFNEFEVMNSDGRELSSIVHNLLKDPIKSYVISGYSINDIEKIVLDEVSILLAEEKLNRNIK